VIAEPLVIGSNDTVKVTVFGSADDPVVARPVVVGTNNKVTGAGERTQCVVTPFITTDSAVEFVCSCETSR